MKSLFILAVVAFACVACGNGDDDPSADSATDDDSAVLDDDASDDDTGVLPDDDADDDAGDDDTWPPLPDDDAEDDDTGDDDTAPPVCDEAPGGETLASLHAGVAVGELYAPVGISMGGYGARSGPRHPFAIMMGASTGYHDRPDVKAVTIDNGADRLVIARIPVALISATLYTRVLDEVCRLTGLNLSEKLWLSSTHSHSGPDHFYGLPVVLGISGMDTYDQRIEDRMAVSIARVIADSMANLVPAKMAVTLQAPFDPTNRLFRDRRCQNNPPEYKEDRMFLARIDREDGSPLAVLVGWGMHGTMAHSTLMTSDAPGAVEHGMESTFDTPVPVLFIQAAGGDSTPVGSGYDLPEWQNLEHLGQRAADMIRDTYDDLTPTDDWTFEMVSKRVTITRDAIGYEDGEFGYHGLITGRFYEYKHGAWGCGERSFFEAEGSIVDCNDQETKMLDGYYGCYVPIHWVEPWSWVLDTAEIGVVRLGDYIMPLMPGELTSWLAKHLRESVETELVWPADKIAAFGYANDTQMYLLMDWDWMQGGYETSMNFWGPKFGEWLAGQNVDLATQLLTPEKENNEIGAPARQRHPWPYSYVPAEIEPGVLAGEIITQAHATYERFDTVTFEWSGGYTALGSPRVTVERDDGAGFAPLLRPDGRTVTDATIDTLMQYAPEPDYETRGFPYQRRHRWRIDWELTAGTPSGMYRLKALGDGSDGDRTAPYTIYSRTFTVDVSTGLAVTDLAVTAMGGDEFRVSCRALMPPNPGGFRLRSMTASAGAWSSAEGGSIAATIHVSGFGDEPVMLEPVGGGNYEGVFTRAHAVAHAVSIAPGGVSDEYGNTNAQGLGPVAFP
ncbi:MAG: hypothetical protein IT350_10605 [Deltaproteobacteria bacterium]|nr:hypothetical protein [Deltaproteobacteria bacterium]